MDIHSEEVCGIHSHYFESSYVLGCVEFYIIALFISILITKWIWLIENEKVRDQDDHLSQNLYISCLFTKIDFWFQSSRTLLLFPSQFLAYQAKFCSCLICAIYTPFRSWVVLIMPLIYCGFSIRTLYVGEIYYNPIFEAVHAYEAIQSFASFMEVANVFGSYRKLALSRT